MLFASNPALFERWTKELRYFDDALVATVPPQDDQPVVLTSHAEKKNAHRQPWPDLVKLTLWHAEWAYRNRGYTGRTGGFEGRAEGYETWVPQFAYDDASLQAFDRQNLLDQLAAVCAFYRPFLSPYLTAAEYQKYRQACLKDWELYDRHKEVRHWVKSQKWIDEGRLEFNEQGSAFGQGLLRNLLMYLAEKNEPGGEPDRFLKYAQDCARDIVRNWDFRNPVHTWGARNAEHITPQALALFLLIAPDLAPAGTREKAAAWRDYIAGRTANLWQYRTHSDSEWAHPKSKEVGTVAGLGGAMFAIAEAVRDPNLRATGWSQVNFVFGCNPAGAHLGARSPVRLALRGFWGGVEQGWPIEYGHGTGMLGAARGTLDGSPTDVAFPFNPEQAALSDTSGVYATEGWSLTNRAWMSTVAFSSLGSIAVRFTDAGGRGIRQAKPGRKVRVELRAALNLDPAKREAGWVLLRAGGSERKVPLLETGPNTGVFAAEVEALAAGQMEACYGYLAWRKAATLEVQP